jgi:hypothetical protein
MFNLKWGLVSGLAAFVFSVVVGFISGVSASNVFLRAGIFSAVFSVIGLVFYVIINSFFPELLSSDDEPADKGKTEQPGSRVDITLDNADEYALPETHNDSPEGVHEVGNIEHLVSEGIDQSEKDGYNNKEGGSITSSDFTDIEFPDMPTPEAMTAAAAKASPARSAFAPSFGDDSTGLGGLPDLDSMALAFSGGSPEDTEPVQQQEVSSRNRPTGNKAQPMQGDFNPKELAEGIRTVLSKDNK